MDSLAALLAWLAEPTGLPILAEKQREGTTINPPRKAKPPPNVYFGLVFNLTHEANACYINSLLQALVALPEFRAIAEVGTVQPAERNTLLAPSRDVVKALISPKNKNLVRTIKKPKMDIVTKCGEIEGHPADSAEVLLRLLNFYSTHSKARQTHIFLKSMEMMIESMIKQPNEPDMRSSGMVKTNVLVLSPFTDDADDLKSDLNCSLQSLLDVYFSPEETEDADDNIILKQEFVVSTPQNLFLQIKALTRVHGTQLLFQGDIALECDLYLPIRVGPGEMVEVQYSLQSFILGTPGHYVAVRRVAKDRWVLFDDVQGSNLPDVSPTKDMAGREIFYAQDYGEYRKPTSAFYRRVD